MSAGDGYTGGTPPLRPFQDSPNDAPRAPRRPSEAERETERARAGGRMVLLGLMFCCAFGAIATKMGTLATQKTAQIAGFSQSTPLPARADITDRHGRVLATNIETYGLYVQPSDIPVIEPRRVARELALLFPELDEATLLKRFKRPNLAWLIGQLSPEQMQAVRDIGDPGLRFGPRDTRLYPNGAVAAHVLGSTGFGAQDVRWAALEGRTGIEKFMDARLSDPETADRPLALSLDLTIQAAVEDMLHSGMQYMNAKGAAAVLMDAFTGEVVSLVSLPDYDPNSPPAPPQSGPAADSPLFNHAVLGRYELGSTFKIFAAAQALELGIVGTETLVDTSPPLKVGGWTVNEFRNKNYGDLTVEGIIVHSSNRGTARLAMEIGAERQQDFLRRLGFFEPTPIELVEARGAKPLVPSVWREADTVAVSYGHALAASPLHLATAYSAIANGGRAVQPTLLRQDGPQDGPRVLSSDVARASVDMLRGVVTKGTASRGDVPGYSVGGKTGTAEKPHPEGGYYEDKMVNTFATIFPTTDPKYVLIVTLDEPQDTTIQNEERRTAGYTAVPVARQIIARIAPLLGLRPEVEQAHLQEQDSD